MAKKKKRPPAARRSRIDPRVLVGAWIATLVTAAAVSGFVGGTAGGVAVGIALPVLVGLQIALSRVQPKQALVLTLLFVLVLVAGMVSATN